ncbi:MAG: hypothetical protein HC929_18110, partial [Leptolyngbyaceae cyanobacterium SM2_5_2]|nr:hypothetical protein [Leptolyngbyaceae cyanobacterium SM2_5_2]
RTDDAGRERPGRPRGADLVPHQGRRTCVSVELHTLPNGLRIAWDSHEMIRSFNPDWQPPTGGHRMGMAFLFDYPAEVDAAFQDLIHAGYHAHKPPFDAVWGQRYAQVEDPDGNVVDLFAWKTEEKT